MYIWSYNLISNNQKFKDQHKKLAVKFFGPYHMIDKIDNMAYKLKLSSSTITHLIFHVS